MDLAIRNKESHLNGSSKIFSMKEKIAFENFNKARIEKKFLLLKRLVEGDFESAEILINEIFESTKLYILPVHLKSIVTHELLDIILIHIYHYESKVNLPQFRDLLSLNEINKILTCTQMNEVQFFFLEIIKRFRLVEEGLKNNGKIGEIYNYISMNLNDPQLTLDSLAIKYNLSNSYISNMFKKEYNITFLDFIHNKRINQAKELLERTEWNITEISLTVGYYSHRTFSTVFKRMEGLTPTDYRKIKTNFKKNLIIF